MPSQAHSYFYTSTSSPISSTPSQSLTAWCISSTAVASPIYFSLLFHLLHESNQTNGTEDARSPENVVSLLDRGLGETLAHVVQEVLEAVDQVVHEGEAEGELEATLDDEGQAAESSGDAGSLEVQADDGGDEVGAHEGVHGGREGASGDSVPGRAAEPGLLQLVDAQVGGHRTVQALVDEELAAFLLGELGAGDGTGSTCQMSRKHFAMLLRSLPGGSGRDAGSQGNLGQRLGEEDAARLSRT